MKQSSKERYLSQKDTTQAGTRAGRTHSKEKRALAPFEKLVIFLIVMFIIATPFAYFINTDIMVYVGLINYLILGLVTVTMPQLVIDLMRKNKVKFEQNYEKRIKSLTLIIRLLGVSFVGAGIYLLYILL